MSTPPPIEYADASPAVRTVYDDIKKTRNVPDVNNFWKYLARDPATLKRTWESIKEIMAPGALDPLTKEMVYLAVSVTTAAATASLATRRRLARPACPKPCSASSWPSSEWRTKPTGYPMATACRWTRPS